MPQFEFFCFRRTGLPSKLVSINSKSKTATDCATVGPQLTNNKAHNVTRYDRIIMVGPLGPSARPRVLYRPAPHRRRAHPGVSTREMGSKNVEISNYETYLLPAMGLAG